MMRDGASHLLGRAKRGLLGFAEQFAYDVAGLPMALRFMWREEPDDPADFLHWFFAQTYWRLPFGALRGVISLAIWPIALTVAVIVFTRNNGRAIARRSGVPVWRQVLGQIELAASAAIAPFWFYMFELFDTGRKARAGLYLTAHETIGPAYEALQPPPHADELADKVWFALHCATMGVTSVPVLLHVSGGKVVSADQAFPEVDLFVKPRSGSGGHRMERWDFIGAGRYRSSGGEVLDRAQLRQRIIAQSQSDDFIVQPRLVNHPALADIANGALSTARVLTCRNEQGAFEVTNAAFRMAIGGNSVVDNFHQGGLATAVDLATGEIGIASDIGIRPDVGWRDTHPVSGARFAGRVLPHWPAAMRLAIAAHEAFPERVIVGWDVAFLADGVSVIEGNGKPDLDIHQRAERRPLGDQRIAALLAFNLRRLAGH